MIEPQATNRPIWDTVGSATVENSHTYFVAAQKAGLELTTKAIKSTDGKQWFQFLPTGGKPTEEQLVKFHEALTEEMSKGLKIKKP